MCIPLYSSVSHPVIDLLSSFHLLVHSYPLLLGTVYYHLPYYILHTTHVVFWNTSCGSSKSIKLYHLRLPLSLIQKKCAFSKICRKEISSINLRCSQEQVHHRRHMRQMENPIYSNSRVFHVVCLVLFCIVLHPFALWQYVYTGRGLIG